MNEQSDLMVRANFTDKSDVSYCIHGLLAIHNCMPLDLQPIAVPPCGIFGQPLIEIGNRKIRVEALFCLINKDHLQIS
jgi:hypothetical protein